MNGDVPIVLGDDAAFELGLPVAFADDAPGDAPLISKPAPGIRQTAGPARVGGATREVGWVPSTVSEIERSSSFTSRQLLFQEVFVGTLIYTVVLGFLDDYTSVVEARSFSYIFFAAIVLEILTLGALAVKKAIVRHFRSRDSRGAVALMAFGVWLVMFSSKFVFVWAIDLVFGDEVDINGFFGILLVALLATVVHRLAEWLFVRLGPSVSADPVVP